MRNKLTKLFTIFILLLLVGTYFEKEVNGFYCGVQTFNTDKTKYYINEVIFINASWDLFYNPSREICYIQVFMSDLNNTIIWNSTKYDEIGNFIKNWTLSVNNLNLTSNVFPSVYHIKFFSYCYDTIIQRETSEFKKSLSVEIHKRNLKYEILSPSNSSLLEIEFGEIFNTTLKLTDSITNKPDLIVNEKISLKVFGENGSIHYYEYILNQEGLINVIVSDFEILTPGNIILLFSIVQNKYYIDFSFNITLIIKKAKLFFELISFKPIFQENRQLNFSICSFYFLNHSVILLENESFYVDLCLYNETIYSKQYFLNDSGLLNIVIEGEDLKFKPKNYDNMTLMILFDGNKYLESNIIELNIKYIKIDSVFQNSNDLLVYNIVIGFIIILLLISIIKAKRKLNHPKKVEDIILLY